MGHKKKRTPSAEVFVYEGVVYTVIHKDLHNALIVEFDMKKKHAGGGVKKGSKSFLDSQKITILALL